MQHEDPQFLEFLLDFEGGRGVRWGLLTEFPKTLMLNPQSLCWKGGGTLSEGGDVLGLRNKE